MNAIWSAKSPNSVTLECGKVPRLDPMMRSVASCWPARDHLDRLLLAEGEGDPAHAGVARHPG